MWKVTVERGFCGPTTVHYFQWADTASKFIKAQVSEGFKAWGQRNFV